MKILKCVAALLLAASAAFAGQVLDAVWDRPTTPAELALGSALLSMQGAPRGMSVNSALLSTIKWKEFCGSGMLWFQDISGGSLNGVLPLGNMGSAAAAIGYWDYGRFDKYDSLGLPEGSINPYAASASVSMGSRVYRQLSLGISFKGALQSMAYKKKYQVGTDLAAAYRFNRTNVSLQLRNWGPQYPIGDSLKFDLSRTVIGGADISLFGDRLKAALQLNLPREDDWYPSAALVAAPWPVLGLRVGYDGVSGSNQRSRWGLGMVISQTGKQDYSLEYGYRSFGDLGDVHSVSLSLSF